MATYQLPVPQPMSLQGDIVENWKEFEDAWEDYMIATKLNQKTNTTAGKELVAATLGTVMGRECKKVMKSLPTLTNEDRKHPTRIVEELRKHFLPQRNVLYERFVFSTATQRIQETVDEFVVRLRQLAESCEFEQLKSSFIRDRLVFGTLDKGGREKLLQEMPVPDLDRVIRSLKSAEISRTHNEAIAEKCEQPGIIQYTEKKRKQTMTNRTRFQSHRRYSNHQNQNKCGWCGRTADHPKRNCPAKDARCYQCSRIGHFGEACRMPRQVNEVDTDRMPRQDNEADAGRTPRQVNEVDIDSITDCIYMMEVGPTKSSEEDFWTTEVEINGEPCSFKLDCGSKVTVINDKTPWLKGKILEKTNKEFQGAGGIKLTHLIKGKIPNALLESGRKAHREDVYIMANQPNNLLSKAAIQRLELLTPAPEVYSVETTPDFGKEFPKLFKGLGCTKEKCTINLRENAEPVSIYTPRRVPHPLLPKVKEKLDTMVEQKVISPVTIPTDWCSGMVTAPKKNGDVRICVDLTALNKSVKREVHPMKSVDDHLAKLKNSNVFTKLDANSGFWQVPLDEGSRLLTTFVTPFGRYCFNRLPFGISSAPEIFQRMMSTTLEGLDGVICNMDDILIHGDNQKIHDERVRRVLKRLLDAGITLNEKCEFSMKKMKFLGHIISAEGIEADPEKTKAIKDFPRPKNVTELQRFNGMVNQLAKFIPDLASINEPLRQLLKKDNQWLWDQPQEEAFNTIKNKLISTDILAHYDPLKRCIVAADASQDGMGAVLLQLDNKGNRRPIAYASRSLNETEKRYAVIEKEALAATWACEKFSQYILGTTFTLETDHRPLVPLLSSIDLSKLPPRILRFRLRMARYAPDITYVQGIHQKTADALSRAPTDVPTHRDQKLIEEIEEHAESIVAFMPATEKRLQEIRNAQDNDTVCGQVKKYCLDGWPSIMPSQQLLKPYWEKKQHLTVTQDLLMYDNRLIIPPSLQLQMLNAIHEGHLGISKCQGRASYSVWWPTITKQIESMVNKCFTCAKHRPMAREPLMPLSFPGERPWSRVGTDLFEIDGKHFVIAVDYTSRWFEIRNLQTTSAGTVIQALSEIFSTHGIPDTVISDNGPQYASWQFRKFAEDWGFTHVTSSPLHPQANGEVERAIQTTKNILKKNSNMYLGLLAYRSAPLQNGATPSEILMGRKIRTKLPTVPANLLPKPIDNEELIRKEEMYRENYKRNYDSRHKIQILPTLQKGDKVYIRDQDRFGTVEGKLSNPRSYRVSTETGSSLRRNRRFLIPTSDTAEVGQQRSPTSAPNITHRHSIQSSPPSAPTITHRQSIRNRITTKAPDMVYY